MAGLAGLAVSHAATMALTLRSSPIVAVAELVIQIRPRRRGRAGDRDPGPPGQAGPDRSIVFLLLLSLWAWAGRLAARSWWAPILVFARAGRRRAVRRADPVRRPRARRAAGRGRHRSPGSWCCRSSPSRCRTRAPRPRSTAPAPTSSAPHTRRTFLIRAGIIAAAGRRRLGVFGRAARPPAAPRRAEPPPAQAAGDQPGRAAAAGSDARGDQPLEDAEQPAST